MSNLLKYAQVELELSNLVGEDSPYEGMIAGNVIELIDVFSKQGHSGMSAQMVVSIFSKLASFEPLSPITCSSDEWVNVHGETFQNIRLSSVFKEGKDGKPYYLNAIVWRYPDGSAFTGTVGQTTSRQFIRLPFTPKEFYVNVLDNEERTIIRTDVLRKAIEYYDGQPLQL